MGYRYDCDLEFLGELTDEQLEVLVETLTSDKDGKPRFTECLTSNYKYKRYYPKHSEYWTAIAEEIQRFGGNTFCNMVRGKGVLYRELLDNVCRRMKISFESGFSTGEVEEALVINLFSRSINEMSEEELREIINDLQIKTTDFTKEAVLAGIQIAIRKGGFASYQLAVIVTNIVAKSLLGHGLRLTTNAAITKGISVLAGPMGWAIAGVWTAVDIAGPAYRITIPICIHVACLRLIHKNAQYREQSKE